MSKAFYVGEQVSFLNQKGGGVVTKINADQIWVRDDTEFEIPFPPSELIKIRQPNGLYMETQNEDSASFKKYPTHQDVWLIWEPSSLENPGHGVLRIGNASEYDITLVLQGKFKGKHKRFWQGSIPLGQVTEAFAWKEEHVEWLRHMLVLCIPSLVVPHTFRGVISLNLETPKTFAGDSKEELFLHPFSPKPAWVVNFNLIQETKPEPTISSITFEPSLKTVAKKLGPPVANSRLIDLHASALWNFPPPASQILPAQLEALHREISFCIQHGVARLTIIHGIGEGKLKEGVRKELNQYEGIKIEEANEVEFGYGALTVFFEV